MIDILLPYLRDDAPRALPPFQLFLKSQATFIRERYNRLYVAQGHESKAVRLLRYILQNVDMDFMSRQTSNYDRYLHHLRYIKHSLDDIFDRVARGRGYHNFFVKSDKVEEFILPIEDINTIVNLPLDTNDWEVWKKVRPVRLWDHDSEEFTINLLNDQLHFTRNFEPTEVLILIDVIALTMKYYIWLTYQRDKEPAKELAEYIPQQLFLHKYVMCDLIWDNSNVWLINQLNKCLTTDLSLISSLFDSNMLKTDSQWGWISLDSARGFGYLAKIFQEGNNNLRPEAILNSKILFGGSVGKRIEFTSKCLNLPLYQRYDYLAYLRDRKLFTLMLNIFKMRMDLPTTRSMLIHTKREYLRMLYRRPWNTCINVALKNQIEQEMKDLYLSI